LGESIGRSEQELKDIIEPLVKSRVLRVIVGECEDLYELAHEFLIVKIRGWLAPEEIEIRKAKYMLEFEYKSYRDSSTVMPLERLKKLHKSKELIDLRLDDSDRCILLRAALEYEYEVLYWLQKNFDNHKAIDMLRSLSATDKTNVRLWAAAGLIGITSNNEVREEAAKVLLSYPDKGDVLMKISLMTRLDRESTRDFPKLLLKELVSDLTKDMVYIPAGTFLMGSDDHLLDEAPVHEVFLDAFWVDKYPVTIGQFREFAISTEQEDHLWLANFVSGTENYPVTIVDWYEANAYCRWCGKRLPTEAQWEKAARGGLTGKRFPWGNEDPTPEKANFGNPDGGPTPVGSYPPNGYGLYDMAGNIEQWVADWYSETYYKQSPRENPTGPPLGIYKVTRAGAYIREEDLIRCAMRYLFMPYNKGPVTGFRAVVPEDAIEALWGPKLKGSEEENENGQ
jgi:formylglycine-generating enzyme required for sulfatase activity